jgi:excisionase family DNA binding protein
MANKEQYPNEEWVEKEVYDNRVVAKGSAEFIEAIDKLREQLYEWVIAKKRDNWMGIKEASEYAFVSDSTIRRAVKKGELKTSKKTGKLLFKEAWINKWLGSPPNPF